MEYSQGAKKCHPPYYYFNFLLTCQQCIRTSSSFINILDFVIGLTYTEHVFVSICKHIHIYLLYLENAVLTCLKLTCFLFPPILLNSSTFCSCVSLKFNLNACDMQITGKFLSSLVLFFWIFFSIRIFNIFLQLPTPRLI